MDDLFMSEFMKGEYTATITVADDGSTNTATLNADNFDDAVVKFGKIWPHFKPEKIILTRDVSGETREYSGEEAMRLVDEY